jgi:hypothetical protein
MHPADRGSTFTFCPSHVRRPSQISSLRCAKRPEWHKLFSTLDAGFNLTTTMSTTPLEETVKEVPAVDKADVDNANDDQQTVQSTTAPDADTIIGEKESSRDRPNTHRRSMMDGLTLPPPPAFDLLITNLSIGIPRPARYLPLPVPIPIPEFLSRKKDLEYLKQTIIRDVNTRCGSGEVLAM